MFARAREAERNAAYHKLLVKMNAVDDLERRMAITERWQPDDPKYKEALAYLTNRQFIRAIEQLQGLVVQRLFELAKANIAGTGMHCFDSPDAFLTKLWRLQTSPAHFKCYQSPVSSYPHSTQKVQPTRPCPDTTARDAGIQRYCILCLAG